MTTVQIAPYGAWKSPITSDLIVANAIRLGQIKLDGDRLYWSESRPTESGRNVVMQWAAGMITERTPAPFNVRTRVHEYGGNAFTVIDGTVYFSHFADQQLYQQRDQADEVPQALTAIADMRYTDVILDASRQRLIAVREDHSGSPAEAVNTLVSINLDGSTQTVLAAGHDFYASPQLSPDGTSLVWLTWDHPNMPWDSTSLWLAPIQADGRLGQPQLIAGGPDESIFQPLWSPDGVLHFVSDRTGWWNLYCYQAATIEPLCPMEAEFGLPQWVFGMATYGFVSSQQILCTYTQAGISYLASLDLSTRQLQTISTPYTSIAGLHVSAHQAAFVGGSATAPAAIVRFDLQSQQCQVLRQANELVIDPGYLSVPEAIAFPTTDNLTAHAFYYAPTNQDYTASNERPPLLVKSHGGPTAATSAELSLSIQYWTSRGFAVLDVNYGGSTGYGRAYRQRLNGQWGIVDVADCVNGAKYLASRGQVDGDRLVIAGGSAGGYTTLCALTFHQVFKAGASYYGVSDLHALATDTHKFESRYLDSLIGPYPERRDLYEQRSPIYAIDRLACPIIFFQGDEDKIVPPNQAEMMVNALKAKGLPVAYLLFVGEQHGFRKAENIKRALDSEFYFYAQVFEFTPADQITPVEIMNLQLP
jgi:dienelactone hydrolase